MAEGDISACLVLGAVTWMPHLTTVGDPYNPKVTGTMLEVLEIFAKHLGFCYRFIMSPDLVAGAQLDNGSWTGVMKLVTKKEVAFTGLGLAVNQRRAKAIDFTEFLYIDEWSAAYKRPQFQSDIAGFVKPYTYTVWVAMFFTIVIIGMVSFAMRVFFEKFSHSKSDNANPIRVTEEDLQARTPSHGASLFDASHWTIGSLLAQSIPKDPRGEAVRFLSGLWLLVSLITATVYRSNLKAMLILPRVSLPFDNIEELVTSGLPVWVPTDSIMHNAALESPDDTTIGRIRKQFISTHAPTNVQWGIKGMLSGEFVFTAPKSGIMQIVHSTFAETGTCVNYVMSESFFKTTLQCILLPKGSPWTAKLDYLIVRLREGGILDHIYRKGVYNATECLKPISSQRSSSLRPMDLGDFYGLFLIYIGGITIVFISFAAELILGSKRRDKITQDNNKGEND